VTDKILAPLGGRPVFLHSVEAFLRSGVVTHFVVVYRDARQKKQLAACLRKSRLIPSTATFAWTPGGTERQDSVWRGLKALPSTVDYVFIHDCARPLIQPAMLAELGNAVVRDRAVILAHRVTDTIKQTPARARDSRNLRLKTLERERLWAMETPQVFEHKLITAAYRKLRLARRRVTDDAAATTFAGHRVSLLENRFPNPKLTTPADLGYCEYLLLSNFVKNAATI
jgi:2-C-methyl-D-erythritol 4-phosphate cytidylyltransferase